MDCNHSKAVDIKFQNFKIKFALYFQQRFRISPSLTSQILRTFYQVPNVHDRSKYYRQLVNILEFSFLLNLFAVNLSALIDSLSVLSQVNSKYSMTNSKQNKAYT